MGYADVLSFVLQRSNSLNVRPFRTTAEIDRLFMSGQSVNERLTYLHSRNWRLIPATMASTPTMSNAVAAVLVAMQSAYWYRLLRVAIPFRGSSLTLSHIFPVLGPAEFHFWKRCSSSWFPAYM